MCRKDRQGLHEVWNERLAESSVVFITIIEPDLDPCRAFLELEGPSHEHGPYSSRFSLTTERAQSLEASFGERWGVYIVQEASHHPVRHLPLSPLQSEVPERDHG